jgi:prophage DNA circulation protein
VVFSALLDALTFDDMLGAVNEGSANGVREAANRKAIINATKVITIAETARLTTTLPFESYTQASATREAFIDAFEAMLPDLSDEVIDVVLLLQAKLVQHLDAVASALPDLRTYTTARMMSAAEVAHDVYGDASRADEVADRNGIGNPNFIPAGTVLELLSV